MTHPWRRSAAALLAVLLILVSAIAGSASTSSDVAAAPATPTPAPALLRFANVKTTVSSTAVTPADTLKVKTVFQLVGRVRDEFAPATWAANGALEQYAVTFKVSVRGARQLMWDDELVKPVLLTRSAHRIGYTAGSECKEAGNALDPDNPVILEITMETGDRIVACSKEFAQKALFDFERTFPIAGAKLRAGDNQVFTQVEVAWTGGKTWTKDRKSLKLPTMKLDANNSPWLAVKRLQ